MPPKRNPNPTFNYAQPPTRAHNPIQFDGKRAAYKYMPEHELVMLIPAKCASTSVRTAFQRKSTLTRSEVINSQLPVYMMLRHPVARFYSAWADKFPHESFDGLLDKVESHPDHHLDVHLEPYWRLMVDVSITNYYTPTTWGQFQADVPGIPDLPHKNSTGRGRNWQEDLSPEQVSRIVERYKDDVRLYATYEAGRDIPSLTR